MCRRFIGSGLGISQGEKGGKREGRQQKWTEEEADLQHRFNGSLNFPYGEFWDDPQGSPEPRKGPGFYLSVLSLPARQVQTSWGGA